MRKLSDFLRLARTESGKTQQEIADEIGISKTTIVFIENGQRKCPRRLIRAIACAYGVSEEEVRKYNFSFSCLSLFRKAGHAFSEDLVKDLLLLHKEHSH